VRRTTSNRDDLDAHAGLEQLWLHVEVDLESACLLRAVIFFFTPLVPSRVWFLPTGKSGQTILKFTRQFHYHCLSFETRNLWMNTVCSGTQDQEARELLTTLAAQKSEKMKAAGML